MRRPSPTQTDSRGRPYGLRPAMIQLNERLQENRQLKRAYRMPSHEFAQPASVDGAGLLNEDASCVAKQFNLRPKRSGPSAARGRGDQNGGARQQFVGLNDQAIAPTLLLVTASAQRAELL